MTVSSIIHGINSTPSRPFTHLSLFHAICHYRTGGFLKTKKRVEFYIARITFGLADVDYAILFSMDGKPIHHAEMYAGKSPDLIRDYVRKYHNIIDGKNGVQITNIDWIRKN